MGIVINFPIEKISKVDDTNSLVEEIIQTALEHYSLNEEELSEFRNCMLACYEEVVALFDLPKTFSLPLAFPFEYSKFVDEVVSLTANQCFKFFQEQFTTRAFQAAGKIFGLKARLYLIEIGKIPFDDRAL